MNEEQAQKLIEQNEKIIELLETILSIAQGITLGGGMAVRTE